MDDSPPRDVLLAHFAGYDAREAAGFARNDQAPRVEATDFTEAAVDVDSLRTFANEVCARGRYAWCMYAAAVREGRWDDASSLLAPVRDRPEPRLPSRDGERFQRHLLDVCDAAEGISIRLGSVSCAVVGVEATAARALLRDAHDVHYQRALLSHLVYSVREGGVALDAAHASGTLAFGRVVSGAGRGESRNSGTGIQVTLWRSATGDRWRRGYAANQAGKVISRLHRLGDLVPRCALPLYIAPESFFYLSKVPAEYVEPLAAHLLRHGFRPASPSDEDARRARPVHSEGGQVAKGTAMKLPAGAGGVYLLLSWDSSSEAHAQAEAVVEEVVGSLGPGSLWRQHAAKIRPAPGAAGSGAAGAGRDETSRASSPVSTPAVQRATESAGWERDEGGAAALALARDVLLPLVVGEEALEMMLRRMQRRCTRNASRGGPSSGRGSPWLAALWRAVTQSIAECEGAGTPPWTELASAVETLAGGGVSEASRVSGWGAAKGRALRSVRRKVLHRWLARSEEGKAVREVIGEYLVEFDLQGDALSTLECAGTIFNLLGKKRLWEAGEDRRPVLKRVAPGAETRHDGSILLYHGSSVAAAAAILRDGFIDRYFDAGCDFGARLYTAQEWCVAYGFGTVSAVDAEDGLGLVAILEMELPADEVRHVTDVPEEQWATLVKAHVSGDGTARSQVAGLDANECLRGYIRAHYGVDGPRPSDKLQVAFGFGRLLDVLRLRVVRVLLVPIDERIDNLGGLVDDGAVASIPAAATSASVSAV